MVIVTKAYLVHLELLHKLCRPSACGATLRLLEYTGHIKGQKTFESNAKKASLLYKSVTQRSQKYCFLMKKAHKV